MCSITVQPHELILTQCVYLLAGYNWDLGFNIDQHKAPIDLDTKRRPDIIIRKNVIIHTHYKS